MRMGVAAFCSDGAVVEAAGVEAVAGVEAAAVEAVAGVLVLMDEDPLDGLSDADWHPASNKADTEVIETQLSS